jgi:hypothetical protein
MGANLRNFITYGIKLKWKPEYSKLIESLKEKMKNYQITVEDYRENGYERDVKECLISFTPLKITVNPPEKFGSYFYARRWDIHFKLSRCWRPTEAILFEHGIKTSSLKLPELMQEFEDIYDSEDEEDQIQRPKSEWLHEHVISTIDEHLKSKVNPLLEEIYLEITGEGNDKTPYWHVLEFVSY